MGQVWFISVTGAVPHSACFFDYKDTKYADSWYGFGPAKHHSPGWPRSTPGKIFNDDETYRLNHGIIFECPDSRMLKAAETVNAQYAKKDYKVCVCDCVSYTADIARQIGLGVPLVNMTPFGLIGVLWMWNNYVRKW